MAPEKITVGEMKDVIKEGKLSPSDLFGIEDLTSDPLIRGYLDTSIKEMQGKVRGEAEQRRRGEEGIDKKAKEWEDEKKKLEDENKTLKTESAKVKATDLFSKKTKERKLNDKQIKFITKKQEAFSPEKIDELEKEVDAFMDSTLEEYKATAEIFGHKTEKQDEPKGGGEPGEGGVDEDNELIPD